MSKSNMNIDKIDLAIRKAEASLRMEGLYASDEARFECRLVLEGKITDEQYMNNVRNRYSKYINVGEVYGDI